MRYQSILLSLLWIIFQKPSYGCAQNETLYFSTSEQESQKTVTLAPESNIHFQLSDQGGHDFSESTLFAFIKICAVNSMLPGIYTNFYWSLYDLCKYNTQYSNTKIQQQIERLLGVLKESITSSAPFSYMNSIHKILNHIELSIETSCICTKFLIPHQNIEHLRVLFRKNLKIFRNINYEHLQNMSVVYAASAINPNFEKESVKKIDQLSSFFTVQDSVLKGTFHLSHNKDIARGTLFKLIKSDDEINAFGFKLSPDDLSFSILRITEKDIELADIALFRSPDQKSMLALTLKDLKTKY